MSTRLFHLLILIVGISIGVASMLCLRSFSFTVPSHSSSIPYSISPETPPRPQEMPPPPQTSPPSPSPQPQLTDQIASNETILGSMHNMTDDELLLKASQTVLADRGPYKVAFMFLTPGPLPLAPFWDRFFKGHEGMYSIYVHPHPDYNGSVPQDSAFYARRIPSQPVHWGTISMIDAERRLLANALLDPTNQRFVLLSDSCIPVMNFTTVYNYLMQTNLSFLQVFDDPRRPGRGRYNRHMWPNITIEQWRKGSQWFEIHRDLAVHVVSDTKYYKVFSEFCTPPCYNDEHYLATLVNILYPGKSSNRTVTFVDWSRGGPHPRKYGWIDVKPELLNRIRFGFECEYNGNTTNMCHLFARKFLPNTLWPLLKIGPQLLGFDP